MLVSHILHIPFSMLVGALFHVEDWRVRTQGSTVSGDDLGRIGRENHVQINRRPFHQPKVEVSRMDCLLKLNSIHFFKINQSFLDFFEHQFLITWVYPSTVNRRLLLNAGRGGRGRVGRPPRWTVHSGEARRRW